MKNEKVSLDHMNLTVVNLAETVTWYKQVFGFSLVEEGRDSDGPWGVLRSGDSMLCIYERPSRTVLDGEASDQFHHIYHFGLRIRDRKEWEETVRRENLKTYYGSSVEYPHSTSWYIKDPTGYMIEVALWNGNEVRFG